MQRILKESDENSFRWIDITEPDPAELQKVAGEFGLVEQSVQDSLQPDHLPKCERLKNYTFSILRFYMADDNMEADTVQELTNKIAVFTSDKFIITIHQKNWSVLDQIYNNTGDTTDTKTAAHVYIEIIRACLQSFEEPANKLTRSIEYYEEQVFLRDNKRPILKGLYFLKRKIDVIRRVLLLTFDIIDQVDPPGNSNAYTRDIRDLYVKQQNIFDALSENTNHLLSIYFNISAQKTNQIIRVLTIFSVFFLPLTFIVGIYGMNFKFMPELNWKFGYPSVYVLMAIVTLAIYIWFKRKKWL